MKGIYSPAALSKKKEKNHSLQIISLFFFIATIIQTSAMRHQSGLNRNTG